MNDKEQKFIMMIGLPASGKSTVAKELQKQCKDCVIISSDTLRKELFGDENDQSDNERVFKTFYKRVHQALSEGKSVITDATFINFKKRVGILDIAKRFPCKKEACLILKDVADCIRDDKRRERCVEAEVIYKFLKSFGVPFTEEGFDEIHLVHATKNSPDKEFLNKTWREMTQLFQKNLHHNHLLSTHCADTAELFERFDYGPAYKLAAKFHDVGKLFTVTTADDGRQHYYSHENVGAYYLLCHAEDIKAATGFTDRDILNMAFLVNYHMMPLKWKESEKSKKKWERRFGMEKTQLIKDFNSCDKSRELEITRTVSGMTESEKEAFVQGIEFTIDYGYFPAEEDYQLYLAIIRERAEKEAECRE